jgi:hypothetical protein
MAEVKKQFWEVQQVGVLLGLLGICFYSPRSQLFLVEEKVKAL